MGMLHDIFGIKSPSEHYLGGNHLAPHQAAQYTPPPMPKFQTAEDIAAGEIPNLARQPVHTHEPGPGHYSRHRVTVETADDRRPCWVRGQKAMFRRWVESAHPVVPRNIPEEQIDDKTRSFQYWSTQALVELEDGSCVRVWPNEVQFADGGRFEDYAWRPMTEGGQGDGAE